MSDFENLLRRAESGDSTTIETICQMFRPLLVKDTLGFGAFDEDLYQELCHTLLLYILKFRI